MKTFRQLVTKKSLRSKSGKNFELISQIILMQKDTNGQMMVCENSDKFGGIRPKEFLR